MARKFIKFGYYLILAALGLVTLFLIATAIPGWGRFRVLVVMSGSMEPSIKTGSVIIINRVTSYAVGDIITFSRGSDRQADLTTTHRVVNIDNSLTPAVYQTKGDANKSADLTPVPARSVQGKVYFTLPYLGYVITGLRRPLMFILMISLAAGLIIFGEIKKIWKEVKKKQ